MAVFPRGIKSFVNHKNLLDDVKAEHINDLQDEVRALEEVLGPLINEVNELNLEMNQDDLNDDASLQATLETFRNLGDQLLAIKRGTHTPVFFAGCANVNIPHEQLGQPGVAYRTLTMTKPNVDSHRTYNGSGFTIPRTGFYMVKGQVNWDTGTTDVVNGFGAYSASVFMGNTTSWSISRMEHYHSELRGVYNEATFLGYAPRGMRVSLRVNQNSNRTIQIDTAFLSSVMFRDLS